MGNLEFPNQVEVVNAAHCNVTDTGGCSSSTAIPLGDDDSEGSIVVDTATHTVYVAGPSAIAVIDTTHCNSTDTSGCASQPVGKISTTDPAFQFAVAPDTLSASFVPGFDLGNQSYVEVIDTRHCRASDTSGCGSLTPATVTVGNGAFSIALAPAHHTLYVPNNNNGEGPGTLSMIGTTNCNGDDSSGCATQPSATTLTGRAPLADQVDPSTGTLYVTNFADASVFTYNTATCNAQTQTGCAHPPREVIVGSGPDDVLVDDAHNTVYVPSGNDGKLSLIPSTH